MKKTLLSATALLLFGAAFAQQPGTAMGGQYRHNPQHVNCISPQQKQQVWQQLLQKKKALKNSGQLLTKSTNQHPLFIWPLQQADGFDYNSTWAISNYVDHNQGYPNMITDYNCGTRSYDTADGYNHAGVDIFTWPFSWEQMQNNQTMVVAAADGQIISKTDGNFDQSCEMNSNEWNAIYLLHADGSISWYGHMKNNSLTTKGVGATVAQGEFLGFVGSSGNSTGPHLHFEVYDDNLNLVDPYNGPCNNLNTETWWQEQKPYENPNINAVLTHTAPPDFNDCPSVETTNVSAAFSNGQTVYLGLYMRDQQLGTTINLRVRRPNGTLFYDWTDEFEQNYSASYWYWSITPTIDGVWSWEAQYEDGTWVTTSFTVGELGTQTPQLASVTVSPNPAKGVVHISGDETITEVRVYDALGKNVLTEKAPDGLTTIDATLLAQGVYNITLQNAAGQQKTLKLVKE